MTSHHDSTATARATGPVLRAADRAGHIATWSASDSQERRQSLTRQRSAEVARTDPVMVMTVMDEPVRPSPGSTSSLRGCSSPRSARSTHITIGFCVGGGLVPSTPIQLSLVSMRSCSTTTAAFAMCAASRARDRRIAPTRLDSTAVFLSAPCRSSPAIGGGSTESVPAHRSGRSCPGRVYRESMADARTRTHPARTRPPHRRRPPPRRHRRSPPTGARFCLQGTGMPPVDRSPATRQIVAGRGREVLTRIGTGQATEEMGTSRVISPVAARRGRPAPMEFPSARPITAGPPQPRVTACPARRHCGSRNAATRR